MKFQTKSKKKRGLIGDDFLFLIADDDVLVVYKQNDSRERKYRRTLKAHKIRPAATLSKYCSKLLETLKDHSVEKQIRNAIWYDALATN